MNKISFCTTCKGRLWQLEQTLPKNLSLLNDNSEIILLDYKSPDNLKEYIFSKFFRYLENGKLKYFEMVEDYAYTSAYAKNVAHRLATGNILFNLDADNFIYDGLIYELKSLKDNQLLLPRLGIENEGTLGRIGYTKNTFYKLNGYNENIVGMKGDDGNLRIRAFELGINVITASYIISTIQNSREQKELYINDGIICNYSNPSPPLNYPNEWGKAKVIDQYGKVIQL